MGTTHPFKADETEYNPSLLLFVSHYNTSKRYSYKSLPDIVLVPEKEFY